jgi:hypothetical protein
MNYLSNETDNKIKLLLENYLIENVFKLDEDTINLMNHAGNDYDDDGEYILKILNQLFINRDFANFSLSNKYIERTDIIEILRYSKLWYSKIHPEEWWYERNIQWWHEDLDCDNDNIYIICWFVYSYSFMNKKNTIELINKFYNINIDVVLK